MDIKDFCRAVADGETIQIRQCAGWLNATLEDGLDRMCGNPAQVRIAPTLTPVDMSVLVGSGIDCEFFENGQGVDSISPLVKIERDAKNEYVDQFGAYSQRCRPRMDHWHSLFGMGIDEGDNLVERLRDAGFDIERSGCKGHVRFGGVKPKFCMPWESDQ